MKNRLFIAFVVLMGACAGAEKPQITTAPTPARWECVVTPSYEVCFAEPNHDGWELAYRRVGVGGSYSVVYAVGLDHPKRRGIVELWFIRDKAGKPACKGLLTEGQMATASPRQLTKDGVVQYDYRTPVNEDTWPSRVACKRLDPSGLEIVIYGSAWPGWKDSMHRAVDLLVKTAQSRER